MSSRGPSLFVSYSGQRGGAERFLTDIVAGLPGPAVVACPPGALADDCRARGIPVVLLRERSLELRGRPLPAGAALVGHAREISRLSRDLEPALIVTWGMRSALGAAAAFRGGRRPAWIARHHDFLPPGRAAAMLRRALRRADAVIVNSAAVADDLGLASSVEVITPGVDLERFAPPATPPTNERPVALWLGAMVEWKRPDLALAVAAQSRELEVRVAGAPLDAAGEALLADLRERATENVRFCGAVDAAPALRGADLLLHTADREPFGIAVAEALACGVPVAAPASGGPAEVVDDSCGRLFRPGDPAEAAAAVDEILGRREELARGARSRAEERLDLERARRRFGELIDNHRERAAGPAGDGLTLVTVTHDSARQLELLLRSVERHLPAAEVVVADSGSQDDSAAIARGHGASVIELDNVGYGTAANAAVARASGPVTVVLNPDVQLLDASLAAVAEELSRPGADRLLVPRVLLADGTRQDVAQHEPGGLASVALAVLPAVLLPRRMRVALEPWRAAGPRRAGWPVGACFAGRTDTLRALGPFDPAIFMYAEDLDLGMRARDAGIETWFWPSACVLHERAHSTRRAFGGEPFELLAQRRTAVLTQRRGPLRARADRVIQGVTLANRIALKTLARRDTGRERRQLAALRARNGR